MKKHNKSNKQVKQYDEINKMDQGLNLVPQILNNALEIDQSNDGKDDT